MPASVRVRPSVHPFLYCIHSLSLPTCPNLQQRNPADVAAEEEEDDDDDDDDDGRTDPYGGRACVVRSLEQFRARPLPSGAGSLVRTIREVERSGMEGPAHTYDR